jgi:mRNA interferase RelE/StbE
MFYRRIERFLKAYRALPNNIQNKVIEAFELFKQDPRHSSLKIKKIQGQEGIWEGRINKSYRFTFHYDKDEKTGQTVYVFRNVDNHDECLKNP